MKLVSRRLFDKPNMIEELVDQREWIKTIPEKLREHQVSVLHCWRRCGSNEQPYSLCNKDRGSQRNVYDCSVIFMTVSEFGVSSRLCTQRTVGDELL